MIHVTRGATSLGAFSEEDVREGLRTGRFLSTDLGWREGMASWQPLSQFEEFREAAPPSPPLQSGVAPSPQLVVPRIVLSRPVVAFTAMKREGGLGEPLFYAIIGGTIGGVFAITYNFVLRSFAPFGDRHGAFTHLFAGLGWIFLLVLTPLLVVIGMFVASAILHVCLMIVGGAKQSFETTFRVICFAEGSASPLLVIPFCGGLISGIWKIVLYCIGLARAHETDTGRAVIAVLLPLIVCCGGLLLIIMMFGALGAWSASHH